MKLERNDLKEEIRQVMSIKELAFKIGKSYSILNQMLNGFITLKPETEKKIRNVINDEKSSRTEKI